MRSTPTSKKKFDILEPSRVFLALLIAVLFFLLPVAFPRRGESERQGSPALRLFASSADACPWDCIKCTSWDPDAWPKTCLTWECMDASGKCGEDDGGGGGPSYQPPTISHALNCSNPGTNGWCIGALNLDLTASDPQGQSVIISGDVNGASFACPNGNTTCSVPLPEGMGSANYKVDSATGLSANGSTTFQLDVTTPQIDGSINASNGTNGWYTSQAFVSAAASDALSGIASFEVNTDNTGWVRTVIPPSQTAFTPFNSAPQTTPGTLLKRLRNPSMSIRRRLPSAFPSPAQWETMAGTSLR